MIRNGLLGEAQADGTMEMWLCSFHEYDFGLSRGRFVFLSKIRRQKWKRFESCMKESEPAQASGITGRTAIASDVSRTQISYRKVWMCPLCWVSLAVTNIHHCWRPVQPGGFRSALTLTHCKWQTLFQSLPKFLQHFLGTYYILRPPEICSVDFISWQKPQNSGRSIPNRSFKPFSTCAL